LPSQSTLEKIASNGETASPTFDDYGIKESPNLKINPYK